MKKSKENKKNKKNNIEPKRWTKFYPEGVKPNLKYSEASIVGYLLEAVARYPESIAYDFYGYTSTYRDLFEKIRDCGKSLKTLGVKKGDKVTICMPNTPSAIIMFYAINKLGAVASMVHPLILTTTESLRVVLPRTKMYLVLVDVLVFLISQSMRVRTPIRWSNIAL